MGAQLSEAEIFMPLTRDDVRAIFERPLPDLLYEAATVHRAHHDPRRVQMCQLENIKSGKCPEDCAYCPQSARWETANVGITES